MKGYKYGAQVGKGVKEHGEKMGYKQGGQVKQSPQFKMRTEKQASMDHANFNRAKENASNERDAESQGRGPVRPDFKEGGEVEVEVVVGNKTTRKSNSGTMNKKEMAKGGMSRRQYKDMHGTTKGYREYMKEHAGAAARKSEQRKMKRMAKKEGGYIPPAENPYKAGTARHKLWAEKYGDKKTAAAKPKGKARKAKGVRGLKSRSERELEAMGMSEGGRTKKRVGGPVAAKKGGAAKKVHKSSPMYGKNY